MSNKINKEIKTENSNENKSEDKLKELNEKREEIISNINYVKVF